MIVKIKLIQSNICEMNATSQHVFMGLDHALEARYLTQNLFQRSSISTVILIRGARNDIFHVDIIVNRVLFPLGFVIIHALQSVIFSAQISMTIHASL